MLHNKFELISEFSANSKEELSTSGKKNKKDRVKVTNAAHNSLLKSKMSEMSDNSSVTAQSEDYLMLKYCYLVSMLETRHSIWQYEYMAFSRRMGEVWEDFCATCWELPASKAVRVKPPNESIIKDRFNYSISEVGLNEMQNAAISKVVETIFSLTGKINLKLDMLSSRDSRKIGIDFKSGFGSNEKGNTDRLLTVGKTYKYLYPDCELYILVRQEDNNNYLEVLRKSGVWNVHCGQQTYSIIKEITGIDIGRFVTKHVDFENDLSESVFDSLQKSVPNCSKYLKWI